MWVNDDYNVPDTTILFLHPKSFSYSTQAVFENTKRYTQGVVPLLLWMYLKKSKKKVSETVKKLRHSGLTVTGAPLLRACRNRKCVSQT